VVTLSVAGSLAGLKVIEFGHYVAGPLLGMMLADQGADVIKVEPPTGDPWRSQPSFAIWNRGKRSIVLDLKTPAGRESAQKLLKVADVVIENFGVGVAERLGIDYPTVKAMNPPVVYCSMPAGRPGERERDRPGWETLVSAETTLYQPEGAGIPQYSPLPIASMSAAAVAADAVAAALIARQRFGIGQYIQVPLSRAVLNVMARRAIEVNGSRDMDGSQHPRLPIGADYLCADGRWFHSHGSFAHFVGILLRVAGRPEWIEEATALVYRAPNREIVEVWRERFAAMFIERPSWEWERAINAAGGAGCVCRTVEEWIDNDHVRESGLIVEVDDHVYGRLKQPGLVANLHRTPGGIRGGAPRLGQHALDESATKPGWSPGPAFNGEVPLPLDGLRVLDLCIVLAGPTCGRMLADFGADVIKINDPNRTEEQYQALDVNRGKRSILLDLKTEGGREVFWKLLESTDVVIENFRPGKMDALGIGYEEIKRRKPEIVFASMNAWGFGGEWSDRAGWEPVAQAFSGLKVRAGGREKRPGNARYPINDYTCGLLGAYGTLLAILERFRTGKGQRVDTGLAVAAGYLQSNVMFDYPGYLRNEPEGARLGASALSRFYRTSDDRYLYLEAVDDVSSRRLTGIPEFAHLARDPHAANEEALAEIFASRPIQYWTEQLERAGVGVAHNTSYEEFKAGTDVWESRGLVTREHLGFGMVTHVGVLPLLSRTPPRLGRPAPAFGADGREILREAGFSDRDIERLRAERAVEITEDLVAVGHGTGELRKER
jgi:crotonobetainyl-CoA:carnitine CoA-transferase CaiB-like acyl-CoA transferase